MLAVVACATTRPHYHPLSQAGACAHRMFASTGVLLFANLAVVVRFHFFGTTP